MRLNRKTKRNQKLGYILSERSRKIGYTPIQNNWPNYSRKFIIKHNKHLNMFRKTPITRLLHAFNMGIT